MTCPLRMARGAVPFFPLFFKIMIFGLKHIHLIKSLESHEGEKSRKTKAERPKLKDPSRKANVHYFHYFLLGPLGAGGTKPSEGSPFRFPLTLGFSEEDEAGRASWAEIDEKDCDKEASSASCSSSVSRRPSSLAPAFFFFRLAQWPPLPPPPPPPPSSSREWEL